MIIFDNLRKIFSHHEPKVKSNIINNEAAKRLKKMVAKDAGCKPWDVSVTISRGVMRIYVKSKLWYSRVV